MTFSLLAEPWLPLLAATGQHQQASLRDALLEPGRWAGLDAAVPLQCLAIYRLLLAICHRAIGPGTFDDRLELLDTWPADRIEAYLHQWAERFDLFGSDRPFMQHPIAPRAGKKEPGSKEPASLASLQIERSSGNNRTLWDRSLDSTPLRLTPAGQAITLITAQQFSGSGTVQGFRTSGSYGLASNLQLVMPVGADLQQTLALNLVLQSEEEHKLDLPCWERELLSEKELRGNPVRVPAGPADRYTYGVRTFLLREDGLVHIAEGEIPPGASPVVDPMSAVVQGSKGPMSLMLRTDRTLWRDATALLGGDCSDPPAVLKHAAELMRWVDHYEPLELLAGGLVVDKGKGIAWRLEQRYLAPALVGNSEAQAVVETLLEHASATSKALFGATSSLCRHWLDQGSDAGADPKDVAGLRSSLQADALFWGSLETEFWGALHALGDGATGDAVLEGWRQTLRLTVRMVWDHCCRQIGDDGRALRAQGKASHALGKVMAGLPTPETVA